LERLEHEDVHVKRSGESCENQSGSDHFVSSEVIRATGGRMSSSIPVNPIHAMVV
jgi:hypothetical protein